MWHRLYKGGSSLEGGTLQQLRNLINRRNVSASTAVSGHVNEVQDFLELVIRCHIIAVAMHYFGMKSVTDEPDASVLPPGIADLPLDQRQKQFLSHLCRIVDRYIIPKQYIVNAESASTGSTPLRHSDNPHACRVELEHSYTHVAHRDSRYLPRSITQAAQRCGVPPAIRQIAIDGVFNYASAVLNDGLLLLEFCDAIREGDGKRILRCWKAMLIYFQYARHSNYAKEAILLQAAVNATATPHVSVQITWSRVVNTSGRPGRNIPVDLHNEHLNRALKTAVAGIGANIAPKTILQCGRSLKGLMDVEDIFDKEHGIHQVSTKHTCSSVVKDEDAILEELQQKSHVFDYIPGRVHHTFSSIDPNPALSIDKEKLFSIITRYKLDLQRKANVARLYKHKF